MAKATALARARRVKQRPKPKPQSAQIGPDGPKHPDNRQLYNKRGCPDAGARLHADYPKPKVATFCAALWLTFTLPLTMAIYPDGDLPVFFGHYWMSGAPEIQSANALCLDYSAGTDGPLVTYSHFSGSRDLNLENVEVHR